MQGAARSCSLTPQRRAGTHQLGKFALEGGHLWPLRYPTGKNGLARGVGLGLIEAGFAIGIMKCVLSR